MSFYLDLVSVSASTIFNSSNLTTTAIKLPDCTATPAYSGVRQICITNKSSSAYVGYLLTSAASPTLSVGAAGVVAATDVTPVLPASQFLFNCAGGLSVWLVASAASTPVSVTLYDTAAR